MKKVYFRVVLEVPDDWTPDSASAQIHVHDALAHAAQVREIPEKTSHDACPSYSAEEAWAWECGYGSAREGD